MRRDSTESVARDDFAKSHMKTAIILHGKPEKEEYHDEHRPAESNCHWIPWIQKQLLLKDIVAQAPEMPVPYNPEYTAWRKVFESFLIDHETILIGHSCGGGFIVRYLSENNINVGKVVLIAPWIDPDKTLKTGMFDFKIDENLAKRTRELVIFDSKNDHKDVQESVEILKNTIKGARVVEFEDKGHFCYEDMQTSYFPELLKEFE